MNDKTDSQLLRAYAEHRSEAAFSELLNRHVDFTYAAALRMVRDAHLAKDVTQAVFLALAKQAGNLTERPVLSGWLHRTAQNIAAQTVRTIERRRAREQEAAVMNDPTAASDATWEHIAPHLDDALGELNDSDRDALLLRYFEKKSAREMAHRLGISDEAAQKRVTRAVEKLRELFAKRGVAIGASGLAVVISANAVPAAPIGLVVTISTAAALTGTSLATTATVTATQAIAMTALQKTLVVSVVIAVGLTAPLIVQHQAKVKLREENQTLQLKIDQLAGLQVENERLSNLLAQANSSESRPNNELLRLRSELGLLRQATNELGKLRHENQQLRSVQTQRPLPTLTTAAAPNDFPRDTWTFAGYADPESAVVSLAWAAAGGDMENFLNSMTPRKQSEEREKWQRKGTGETEARIQVVKEFGSTKRIRVLDKEILSENEIVLNLLIEGEYDRRETPRMKLERINNEWKMAGPYRPPAQKAP